jgi:hypothetical protein
MFGRFGLGSRTRDSYSSRETKVSGIDQTWPGSRWNKIVAVSTDSCVLIEAGYRVFDDGIPIERFEHGLMLIAPTAHAQGRPIRLGESEFFAAKWN